MWCSTEEWLSCWSVAWSSRGSAAVSGWEFGGPGSAPSFTAARRRVGRVLGSPLAQAGRAQHPRGRPAGRTKAGANHDIDDVVHDRRAVAVAKARSSREKTSFLTSQIGAVASRTHGEFGHSTRKRCCAPSMPLRAGLGHRCRAFTPGHSGSQGWLGMRLSRLDHNQGAGARRLVSTAGDRFTHVTSSCVGLGQSCEHGAALQRDAPHCRRSRCTRMSRSLDLS